MLGILSTGEGPNRKAERERDSGLLTELYCLPGLVLHLPVALSNDISDCPNST